MKHYQILVNETAGKKFSTAEWHTVRYDSGGEYTVAANSKTEAIKECRRDFGGRFNLASLKAEQL